MTDTEYQNTERELIGKQQAIPELDERTDTLVRMVNNKVDLEGDNLQAGPGVPFSKLFTEANGSEKCKLYMGWFFAALSGAILPTFFFFIGPIFDSFGGDNTPEETRDQIRGLCAILGCISIGIMITSFLQNFLLDSASASITAKLKTRYLQAVLAQESAWYDQTNYLELASRLTKECD